MGAFVVFLENQSAQDMQELSLRNGESESSPELKERGVIMNKMRFDVKCVKECLIENKIVYTVRSWEGYKELSKVEVDGVGLCTKKRVMRVTRKDDLALGICR